ncbi:Pentatricopeptide repeat-containing protein [Nymphaea thermarum]|nr:Pentatricopeptide repeat-containing protein [Nymphaea thermarum]
MLQPTFTSVTRRPNSSFLLPLLQFSSIPISPSPPPTNQDVAQLILDQKSASQALHTFRWASRIPTFLHNQTTYKAIIHKLCLLRQFEAAGRLLSEIPDVLNSPPDEEIFVRMIRDYGQFKMSQEAIKVLDLVVQFSIRPSLKICNSILNVLVKDDIDLAREFFRNRMVKCGVLPDEYTFGILMKGLCVTNRIGDGFKLLQFMKNNGFEPNTVIYNTLIYALCKNGKVGRGRSLLREMAEPSDVTFNILISAYCRDGDPVQAMVLFGNSLSHGFVPDVITVTKLVECFCDNGRVREAVEVLQRAEEKGVVVDTVTYNTLINGFCRNGEVEFAEGYLKEMALKGCLPNLSTFNLLIEGYCKAQKLDMALDLFHDMRTEGTMPNWCTYDKLVRGLCEGGRIEKALEVLNLMEENKGVGENQKNVYNTFMYGLYKENRIEEAHKFLHRMKAWSPRVVDQTLRILKLCRERKTGEAKNILDQMLGEGDMPCVIAYSCLVDGFCREGNLRKAFGMRAMDFVYSLMAVMADFDLRIGGFDF